MTRYACPIDDVPWGPNAFAANTPAIQPIYIMPPQAAQPANLHGSHANETDSESPGDRQLSRRMTSAMVPSFMGMRCETAIFILYVFFAIVVIFLFHINSKVNNMIAMMNYLVQLRRFH